MGAYKYYNPSTQQWEIVKSKSIIKPDGSLEYTPDDIKTIDDKIGILTALPTTTGVANTYSVNIGGLSALATGLKVTVKFNLANTGVSTLNINGLGAKSIKKAGGAVLTNGNLKANGIYSLVYDGTSFQLQGEGGEYGTAQANDVLSGKTIGTDDGLVMGSMPNNGAKAFTPTDSTQTSGAGYYSGITVNPRPAITGNAGVTQVLAGRTFYSDSYTKQTGSMPNRGNVSKTITTQGGSFSIPAGYYTGGSVKAQFANLSAGNIKSGVTVGGVRGSYTPTVTKVTHSFEFEAVLSKNSQETKVFYHAGTPLAGTVYGGMSLYYSQSGGTFYKTHDTFSNNSNNNAPNAGGSISVSSSSTTITITRGSSGYSTNGVKAVIFGYKV